MNYADPDGEDWVDFIPVVGSVRDIYQGVRDGDWLQAGMGLGGLVLDVSTFGTGTVVKGGAKSITRAAAQALKETVGEGTEQVVKNVVPNPVSQFANKTSGNNPYAQSGKRIHKDFKEQAPHKGIRTDNTTIKDPKNPGKKLRPDGFCGDKPVELKPDTLRGHKRAKTQGNKYREATGQEPVIVFYDPITGKINWPW